MFFQAVLVTVATLTAAPQQNDHADHQSPAAAVDIVQADAGAIVAQSVAPLGPRLTPFIWAPAPAPAPIGAPQPSSGVMPDGGQHVVVVSTLSLVLGIIILVLLIK